MTYEQMAIIEALKRIPLMLTPEEETEVAKALVASLHEQHYRLTSDDAVSLDD